MSKPGFDHIGVGVGALIFDDQGRVLLALRGQKAKNERGKWEIPGGALEYGETLEQAIIRECKEELGVEVEVVKLLQVADHILPEENQHWVSPTYVCQIVSGVPKVMEPEKCDKVEWFSLEEASELPLSMVTLDDIEALKKIGTVNIQKLIRNVEHINLLIV